MVSAVLTLIAGAIFTLLHQSQRSYQSQQDLSEVVQQARNAMDQITTSLRQAGNDSEEIFGSETPPPGHTHSGIYPIEILVPEPSPHSHIRINSDITGSVPDAGAPTDPLKATGDPDGNLNNLYEQVEVRYNFGQKKLYIDIGSGEQVLAENIVTFELTFYDIAGTQLTDPADNEKAIARVHVQLVAETENPDLETDKIQSITLQSDVMLRSKAYGLFKRLYTEED